MFLHQSSLWIVKQISIPELLFSGKMSEELNQIKMLRDEILELFGSVKGSKSIESNAVHPRVVKVLKCKVVELLMNICNFLLKSAFVPEDWQTANVMSIFKKDL